MCRNIKRLYNLDPQASDAEIHASALQFVRKVTGMRSPSQANQAAFDQAVGEITAITLGLMAELETKAAPRSREEEARRAQERGRKREERMRARLLEGPR